MNHRPEGQVFQRERRAENSLIRAHRCSSADFNGPSGREKRGTDCNVSPARHIKFIERVPQSGVYRFPSHEFVGGVTDAINTKRLCVAVATR